MPDLAGETSASDSDKDSFKDRLKRAGQNLSDYGTARAAGASAAHVTPVQYRTGGKVRKTGPAIVHRGERVIPASKRKKAERAMKRQGMSLTNKKRKSGRSGGR